MHVQWVNMLKVENCTLGKMTTFQSSDQLWVQLSQFFIIDRKTTQKPCLFVCKMFLGPAKCFLPIFIPKPCFLFVFDGVSWTCMMSSLPLLPCPEAPTQMSGHCPCSDIKVAVQFKKHPPTETSCKAAKLCRSFLFLSDFRVQEHTSLTLVLKSLSNMTHRLWG